MASAATDTCLSCYEDFKEGEDALVCAECFQCYHLGKCAGMSARVYNSKDDEAKKNLRCPTCRLSQSSRGSNQTAATVPVDVAKQLAHISKCLAVLTTKVSELGCLKETVDSIEASVQHMSDKFDGLVETSTRHQQEIEKLRSRVETLENSQDKDTLEKVTQDLNDLEQYSRRKNMEIHGLPFTEKENLLEKINNLAQKLDLPPLSDSDVDSVHRLRPRPNKVPITLIRFSRRSLKAAWLAKRNELKEQARDVRFFDNLTPMNKHLLWLAKTKAKELNYDFAWCSQGKVLVKKDPNALPLRIACESDLGKMVRPA